MQKKVLLLSALLTGAVWTAAAAPAPLFNPCAVSKRVINIGKKPVITLVKDGKVQFEVVHPRNKITARAAGELIARLSEITGTKIKAVAKASGKVPAFYLGVCPESKAAGIDPAQLDRDGFYIKTVGKNIFITGVDTNERYKKQWATLFGVYDFLERFAGVRYYFPGKMGTIVPQKKNWSLPQIDIAERPDTQYRWIYVYESRRGGGDVAYAYPGMKESNPAIWRNSSLNSIRSCHGLNDLQLARRFRKTNPEFFALAKDGRRHDGTNNTTSYHKKGHLCYSSKGLLEEVYKDCVAALTGQPAKSRGISSWPVRWNTLHVNPTPNDGVLWCQCPPCKAIEAKGKQAKSDHIWRFFVAIANRLKADKIPGVVLVDSYGVYSEMPQMEIPDNIILNVAVTGPWGVKNDHVRQSDDARIIAWRKRMGQKIGTWTYPTKACAAVPGIPNFSPRAVAEFYKKHKDNIFGGFVESGTDCWLFGFLNHYVCGKVMWDFSTDVEALIDEHCRLMYGKAAPLMNQFYRELENIWMKEILKEIVQTAWGDNWLLPTRRDIWTKIYSPERIARISQLLDRAEKAAAKDKASLARVRFMREQLWAPVVKGSKDFSNENASRAAWTLYAGKAAKITLDGKLNEKEWKKAVPVNLIGANYERVQVQTRVKALVDKDYIYFGFEADEPETEKMSAVLTRKPDSNEVWRDNGVEVFLSAAPASDFIYQYITNSLGFTSDLRNTLKGNSEAFNSGFEVKTSVVPGKKYFVEMRIPLKSMPELQGRKRIVGNFTRHRVLKGKIVKPAFYAWFPKKRNIAEDCGVIVLDGKATEKNLLKSPDFEKAVHRGRFIGGGDWAAGGKVINRDTQVFLTRGASLRMDKNCQIVVQNLPVEPNKKYRLSFYVKTENASPGLRALLRFGANVNGIYVFGTYLDYIRGTVNWHRVEKVFKTPKAFGGQYKPRLDLLVGKNEKGACWIDHVELVEVK